MNDGGPAFPGVQHCDHDCKCHACGALVVFRDIASPGLSLRDYFAAAALQGVFSDPFPVMMEVSDSERDALVRKIWFMADAMLAERGRKA